MFSSLTPIGNGRPSAHLGRGILPLIGGGISAMRGGWTMREPLVNWCGADIRHGMDGELTFSPYAA